MYARTFSYTFYIVFFLFSFILYFLSLVSPYLTKYERRTMNDERVGDVSSMKLVILVIVIVYGPDERDKQELASPTNGWQTAFHGTFCSPCLLPSNVRLVCKWLPRSAHFLASMSTRSISISWKMRTIKMEILMGGLSKDLGKYLPARVHANACFAYFVQKIISHGTRT